MENYIYIIIGIVWVVYSLYSAKQKAIKKQQSSGMPTGGPSQSSPLPIPGNQGDGKSLIDDILRELTGNEPRPVAQPVNQPVSQPAVSDRAMKPRVTSIPGQTYEKLSESQIAPSPETDFLMNNSENKNKRHPIHQQIKEGNATSEKFDLRQAVIYSELLSPKYF